MTLVNFNGADGRYPYGGLIADAAGDLFGTTTAVGGASGDGLVFELVKNGGENYTLNTLASFNVASYPSGLIADFAGDLFGETQKGGSNNDGTVFELVNSSGSYALTILLSFNGSNGSSPQGGLIILHRRGPLRHDGRRRSGRRWHGVRVGE